MKIFKYTLILFFLMSCKTEFKLSGKYQANLSDSTNYIFNFTNKQFTHKLQSGTFAKGKFKTLILSPEKTLLVCNNVIFKRSGGSIKETNSNGDSITIGAFIGFKNFGSTVFEISSKKDSLSFRKTYANELQKTESEGTLIKK